MKREQLSRTICDIMHLLKRRFIVSRIHRSLNRWVFSLLRIGELLKAIVKSRKYFNDWLRLLFIYIGIQSFHQAMSFNLRSPPSAKIRVWEAPDIITIFSIFCAQEYEVLSSDTLILDIGANIGIFTLYAAIFAPKAKIISYEPVRASYERLCNQVKLIEIADRIICRNIGVSGEGGEREIYIGESSVISSLYHQKNKVFTIETIQTVSLTSIVEEFNYGKISLLKMDCEGAEWEVFDQCPDKIFSIIERICLEIHPMHGRSIDQFINKITGIGFSLHKVRKRRGNNTVVWFGR